MQKLTLLLITLGLFSLVNAQVFWEEVLIPQPGAAIACINIDDNNHVVLATFDNIYYSDNSGDSWSIYGSGLPDDDIQSLVITSNGDMFAGTFESGIYKSSDNGSSWNAANNGLPNNAMITALIATANDEIFAGLYPEGVYRTTDYAGGWEPYNNGLPFSKIQQDDGMFSVNMFANALFFLLCVIYFQGMFYLPVSFDMDYRWYPDNMAKGIYLLKVQSDNTCRTSKLVYN